MVLAHFLPFNCMNALDAVKWQRFVGESWAFHNTRFLENTLALSDTTLTSWPCNFLYSTFSSCLMSTIKAKSIGYLGSLATGTVIPSFSMEACTSALDSKKLSKSLPLLRRYTSVKWSTSAYADSLSCKMVQNCQCFMLLDLDDWCISQCQASHCQTWAICCKTSAGG